MRSKILFLLCLCAGFTLVSCNKDDNDPPANELLGPETSKVLHYSFNGNLKDGSGNNLNAADSTNMSYAADRFGRSFQAAAFGGPSNISFVVTPSLSSKVTGFPFSVSLWFKTTNVSNNQTLLRCDGGESGVYSGYWLQTGVGGAGTMSFSFGDNTGNSASSRNTITTPTVFSANTWYHVVINVRGANDMDFYINGIKNPNCTYSGDATTMVYNPTHTAGVIGIFPGAGSTYEGLIDDYRIYTKNLTQAEVSSLYNFHP